MRLIYTGERFKKKPNGFFVFLAGPTPRDKVTKSWRPEMVAALKERGFSGNVVIPEYRGSKPKRFSYRSQVEWEVEWLGESNSILFWVPRNMKFFPALTTNIEFGEHMHSGKIILGFPRDAEHMEYFKARAEMHDIPYSNDMNEVVDMIINKEKVFLHECPRCYGEGQKDSNGKMYKCGMCEGVGFLEPSKKKGRKK